MLAEPAAAQSIGEKTGVNSALGITPKTTDFVAEVAASDMFEIHRANLPWQRQKRVEAFANQLVGDHTKTSSQGKPLDQEANASIPPPDRSSAQQSMLQKLQGMIGQEFAKQYVDDRASSHKDAVSLFERYRKAIMQR